MTDVVPSIFENDFPAIAKKVGLVAPHVSQVQIDIADNSLVPAQSFVSIESFAPLIKTYPQIAFEAHMLVANPEKYFAALVHAGFKRVIVHVECNDPRLALALAQKEDIDITLALDAPTELEQLEPFLDETDDVLMLTVEAGASGQTLLPEAVEKINTLRSQFVDLSIRAKGGITPENVSVVLQAGATAIVVNNFLFKDLSAVEQAIYSIKEL